MSNQIATKRKTNILSMSNLQTERTSMVWIDILSMRILSNDIGCLVGTWNGRVNIGSGSDNELRLPKDSC